MIDTNTVKTGILTQFSTAMASKSGMDEFVLAESSHLLQEVLQEVDESRFSCSQSLPTLIKKLGKSLQVSSAAIKNVDTFFGKFKYSQMELLLDSYLLALKSENCSNSTIKNYRSDIRQFLNFTQENTLLRTLTKPKVAQFLRKEKNKGLAKSSIKRKVVSLSQFGMWLELAGVARSHSLKWLTELNQQFDQVYLENLVKKEAGSKAETLTVPTPKTIKVPEVEKPKTTPKKVADPTPSQAKVPFWSRFIQQASKNPLVTQDISTAKMPKGVSPLKAQDRRFQLKQRLFQLQSRLSSRSKSHVLPYLNLLLSLILFLGMGYFGYLQIFSQVDQPLAFPSTLTRPNRTLSFQGRLTDSAQNPILTASDMRFRLYDSGPSTSGGTLLWDSNTCSVTPDQDGIFAVGLGSDCGGEIGSDVFSENSNVWLQVEVESEILDPRQSIKSVAYALNSETLQGYPASASAVENTVVIMDNNGEIVLGNANPVLRATGDSFAIEAETLTLRTATGSNGDITLSPDGSGQINLLSDVTVDGYIDAPGATLSATYAGGTALTLKAGPSATADIMRWASSAGTTLGVIDENGNVGIGVTDPGTRLYVTAPDTTDGTSIATFRGGSTNQTTIFRSATAADYSGENVGAPVIDVSSGTLGLVDDLKLKNSNKIWLGQTYYGNGYLQINGSTALSGYTIRLGNDGTYQGPLLIKDGLNAELARMTTSGNLGLGSTSPSQKLDVVGAIRLGTAGAGNVLNTSSGSAPTGDLFWGNRTICDSSGSCGGAFANYWRLTAGAFSPVNDTADLLIGGVATSSAKFAFINVNSGTPTASIAGSTSGNALSLTGDGTISTSLNRSLILNPNGGRVGIGTTSPGEKLELNGNIKLSSFTNSLIFGSSANVFSYNAWTQSAGAGTTINNTAGVLKLFSQGNGITVNNGNVGIGTSNPTSLLSIKSASNVTPTFNIYRSDDWVSSGQALGEINFSADSTVNSIANNTGARITAVSGGAWNGGVTQDYPTELQFWTTPNLGTLTQRMVIDKNGNLGIGSTSPIGKLNVSGAAVGKALTILNETGNQDIFTASASGATKFVISNTGNVGIGTNNPTTALSVRSSGDTRIRIDTTSASGNTGFDIYNNTPTLIGSYQMDVNSNVTTLLGYSGFQFTTNTNAQALKIANTGNVGIGTTTTSSFLVTSAGSIGPNANNTYDLGSNALRWNNVYANAFLQNGNTVCDSSGNCSSLGNYWRLNAGTISPVNDTLDFFVGANATASAKFAVLNVNSGTPTASISSGVSGNSMFMAADGSLSTTRRQSLTIGNSSTYNTTGNVLINPNGTGNVGIGTTAPAAQVQFGSSGGQNALFNINTNDVAHFRWGSDARVALSLNSSVSWGVGPAAGGIRLGVSSSGYSYMIGNGTSLLLNPTAGSVGIGTTSPTALLDIAGSASTSGTLAFRGTTDPKIDILNGEAFGIRTSVGGDAGLTERLTVTNNGNVGVGTTAPGAKLDIYNAGGGQLQLNGGGSTLWDLQTDGSNFFLGISSNYDLFQFTNSGNFYVKTGNVGIGSTGPVYKLDVNGTGRFSGLLTTTGITNATTAITNSASYTQTGGSDNTFTGKSTFSNATYSALFTGGSVGIGNSTPVTNLHLRGAAADIDSVTAGGGNLSTDWNNDALFKIDQAESGGNAMAFSVSGTGNERRGYIQVGHTSGTFSNTLGDLALNPFGGNVGIGSTSPAYKLDVNGTGRFTGLLTTTGITNSTTAITNSASYTQTGGSDNTFTGKSTFSNATYSALFTGGNVGIGTSAPARQLEIAGITRITDTNPTLELWDSSVLWQVKHQTTGLGFINSSNGYASNLFIANSGNVGIGTTAPGSPLEVNKDQSRTSLTGLTRGLMHLNAGQSSSDLTTITFEGQTGAGASAIIGSRLTASGSDLFFGTSNSWASGVTNTALFIKNDGNVGIGTTTPSQTLHIQGNARLTGALYDVNNSAGTSGQLLSSTGTGVDWVDASSVGTNYWSRVAGNLYPATVNDTISATSSASTVATFTATSSNTALRAGGASAYASFNNAGNLTFTNASGSTIDASAGLTIGGTSQTGLILGRSTVSTKIANLTTNGVVYTSGADGTLNSEAQLAITRGGTNGTATPTAGAIAYGTGSAYAFSSAGTANQILTSGGTGTPTFQNIASLLTAGTDISITGTTNATINNTSTLQTVTDRGATTSNAITISATGTALNLSGAATTGINLSNTGITTDINLQNGETIDNNTDGRITFTGDIFTSGNTYFANGTTYYVDTSGHANFNNITGAGTLDINGAGTHDIAGTLNLSGSALTTSATTFALLDATATTINFGGAASTLNIGPVGATATSVNIAGGSGATGCTVDGATGNLTCSGTIIGAGSVGFWQLANGALSPSTPYTNNTDLLIGSNASASAKFAILNVFPGSGTPTASVSTGLSGTSAFLTAGGKLGTANRMALQIGNSSGFDTTGNILLHSNGTGNVGIGTTNANAKLALVGSSDAIQFIIKANGTQSNSNPLMQFQNSSGTELFSLHSDHATNIFLGNSAGENNTVTGSLNGGEDNTFIGYLAGSTNTTGNNTVAVGSQALQFQTSGENNVALGAQALYSLTTASDNIAIGLYSQFYNESGNGNIAIGDRALHFGIDSGGNVALGGSAGYGVAYSSISNNVLIGDSTGFALDTGGDNNILVGTYAGDNITTGSNNIVLGYNIDAPSATSTQTLTIGNLIYGTGLNGTGTTVSTGNIGIGSTTPTAKLDIAGSASSSGTLAFRGTTDPKIDILNGEAFGIRTSPGGDVGLTERLTVLNNGNVGIGSTTPTSKLEISGDVELTNLLDNDASNFFDGGCSATTTMTGIDSTGAITCTAITGVPASSIAFSGITSGTNTQAAMVVGNTASLTYSGSGTINASTLIGGTWAAPGTIGSTTPNSGAFTTLTSSGNSTIGTGSSTTNTFGAGASSVNTIGSVTTPGALTLHGATTLDNTLTVSGSNLTTLGGNLTVTGTAWTATPTISGLVTMTSGFDSNAASTVSNLTIDGVSGTALNISNTGITTDINLQNGETIDNNTDGRITFTGDSFTTGNSYFANGTTYYVNTSGHANFNNITGAGTLDINGVGTHDIAGTLNLSGAALTTNQTTFALLNTTATTINFAGAASTLNIGPVGATATSVNIAGGNAATGCTVDGATGNLTCSGTIIGAGSVGFWQLANGAISPSTPYTNNSDLLIGGDASASAKFAVLNVYPGSGTPTASVSSGLNGTAMFMTADGTLSATRRSNLTIGNSSTYDTTGNVLINSNGTGNVGIGTTGPGSFKLQVTGSVGPTTDDTYDLGSNSLRWQDLYVGPASLHVGTSTTDEGTISYDTTGNIFNFGTDSTSNGDIAFFTDDLYLDKSTSRVGIGTIAPTQTLDVNGRYIAVGRSVGGNSEGLYFTKTDQTGAVAYTITNNSGASSVGQGVLNFYDVDNAVSVMSMKAGNVGIGTISPTASLDIAGSASSSGTLAFRGTTDPKIDILNGEAFGIRTSVGGDIGLTERLTVLNNGNVGIGVSTPTTNLHVRGATADIDSVTAGGGNLSTDWNNDALFKIDQAEGSGNTMAFSVSGTANERKGYIQVGHTGGAYSNVLGDLSLNPFGGNVGIGDTTPSYNLDVTGAIRSTTVIHADTNGGMYFDGGDDAALYDVNIANTLGVYGQQASTEGHIKLGSAGPVISGVSGNVGIGDITPGGALDVASAATSDGYWLDGKAALTGETSDNWLRLNQSGSWTNGVYTPANLRVDGDISFDGVVELYYSGVSDRLTYRSGNSTVTAIGMTDSDNTAHGYLYGSGDGTNFGLLDGDGNWMLQSVKDTSINFLVNNSQKMTILADGNVGIGDTTPTFTLDVNGTMMSTDLGVVYQNDNCRVDQVAQDIRVTFPGHSTTTSGSFGSYIVTWNNRQGRASYLLQAGLQYGSGNYMSVTMQKLGGNLDAGYEFVTRNDTTTVLLLKLNISSATHQSSTASFTSTIVEDGGNRGKSTTFACEDRVGGWVAAGAPDQYLGNGNVGIGTTNPSNATLSIVGTSYISGNVGIGTNPAGAGARLVVQGASSYTAIQGNASGNGSAVYGEGGSGTTANGVYGNTSGSSAAGAWGRNTSSGYGVYAQNTSTGFAIYCDATAANKCGGDQAWYNASDRRLKKEIQTIDNALDKVLNLQGVTYIMKEDITNTRVMGFIAQDTLPYAPEVVSYDSETDYYGMSSGQLTALLVEAMKTQQNQINQIKNNQTLSFTTEGELAINGSNGNYTVTASGNTLTTIVGASKAVFGKVTAGLITTKELVVQQSATIANLSVNSMQVSGQSLSNYIKGIVQQELQTTPLPAGSVATDFTATNLNVTKTATISGDLKVAKNATVGGTLLAKEVNTTTLTASTSALGSLLTQTATVSGDSTVKKDASVAGTLIAGTVDAESSRFNTLEARMAQLEAIKAQTAEIVNATISGTLYADTIYNFDEKVAGSLQKPSLLQLLTNSAPPEPEAASPASIYEPIETAGYQSVNPDLIATDSALLSLDETDVVLGASALFVEKYLEVNGHAYISQTLGIGNTLKVGNSLTITNGTIDYQPAGVENPVLAIQSSGTGTLDLLAGVMRIEAGKVVVTGDFTVAGNIKADTLLTNLVQPADFGTPFQVQVAGVSTESGQVKKTKFEIIDENGSAVASFDADGNASFSGMLSVANQNLTAEDTSDDTVTTDKSSGKAKLTSGKAQLKIQTPKATADSLIYVTPKGSTENKVLYIKSQADGEFTVGFDAGIGSDVEFNWWIVN